MRKDKVEILNSCSSVHAVDKDIVKTSEREEY